MFSFQQSDELVFHQIPSSVSFQQPARIQQDLTVELHDHVAMVGNKYNRVTKSPKLHRDQSPSSKPNSATTDGVEDGKDEHAQRKLVHRETERQRRQDMSKLYASLRGQLPLEFLKGKRSTSDHTHQAVNYIKHMKENIRVLSVKRDTLKKLVEKSVLSTGTNINDKSLVNLIPNTVSINSCNGGIQILINSCLIEDGFPLSRVLKAISEEGLVVITYTFTKVNQRLIHSIQTEANDPVSIDNLEQRLAMMANNCRI